MYYRNSYGYLMNYSGESNKLPNTNQYSNPSYNINTNYSQKNLLQHIVQKKNFQK